MSEHPDPGATRPVPVEPPTVGSDRDAPGSLPPAVADHPDRWRPIVEHIGVVAPGQRRPGDPKVTIVLPRFHEVPHVLLEFERIIAVLEPSEYPYESQHGTCSAETTYATWVGVEEFRFVVDMVHHPSYITSKPPCSSSPGCSSGHWRSWLTCSCAAGTTTEGAARAR